MVMMMLCAVLTLPALPRRGPDLHYRLGSTMVPRWVTAQLVRSCDVHGDGMVMMMMMVMLVKSSPEEGSRGRLILFEDGAADAGAAVSGLRDWDSIIGRHRVSETRSGGE